MCCHRVFHTQFPCPVQCQYYHHYPWLIKDDCSPETTTLAHSNTYLNCNPKQLQFSNQINEHTHTHRHTHARASGRSVVQYTKTHQYVGWWFWGGGDGGGCVRPHLFVRSLTHSLAFDIFAWIKMKDYNSVFLHFVDVEINLYIVWSDPKWQTQIGWGKTIWFWNPHKSVFFFYTTKPRTHIHTLSCPCVCMLK